MGMDIRMPIGIMFGILGVFLVCFGAFGDKAIYYKSLGVNINLSWGFVLIIFAAVMIGLAMRASRNPSVAAATSNDPPRRMGH